MGVDSTQNRCLVLQFERITSFSLFERASWVPYEGIGGGGGCRDVGADVGHGRIVVYCIR